MKSNTKRIFLALLLPAFWLLDFDPSAAPGVGFVQPANAVVGRPATPVSVAGVARRTTRRTVVYSSTAAASASQQQAAAQQQQAAPQPQPAAAPPAGTVVTALPAGCTSTVVDGVNLFNCGGVMYQPTFQSNNLVYVVK
jgi:hypothetical protein